MTDRRGPFGASGSRPQPRPLPAFTPAKGFGNLPVGRWFTLAGVGIALVFMVSAVVTIKSIEETREARETLVDVVDPAALRLLEISNAMTSQESSVRAYGRTNEEVSLQEYRNAIAAENDLAGHARRAAPPDAGAAGGHRRGDPAEGDGRGLAARLRGEGHRRRTDPEDRRRPAERPHQRHPVQRGPPVPLRPPEPPEPAARGRRRPARPRLAGLLHRAHRGGLGAGRGRDRPRCSSCGTRCSARWPS